MVPRPTSGKSKKDARLVAIDQKIESAKKALRILKDEKRRLLKQIEQEQN